MECKLKNTYIGSDKFFIIIFINFRLNFMNRVLHKFHRMIKNENDSWTYYLYDMFIKNFNFYIK